MKKALLVVDMQNVCVGKQHADYFKYDTNLLISNVNKIISQYDKDNVIYICNIIKNNLINTFAPFKVFDGSQEAKLVDALNVVNNNIIKKYNGNAFKNTQLLQMLKLRNVDSIEIVGVDGGGCVALTALGAIEHGFKVFINCDAVGTMFINKAKKLNKKLLSKGAYFN